MKPNVKKNLQRYSGIQLILLAMNGSPKIIRDIDKELDRRALKGFTGQDQREPVSSGSSSMIPMLAFS